VTKKHKHHIFALTSLRDLLQTLHGDRARRKGVIAGRMPQSGKLPVLNLLIYLQAKNQVFPSAGATRCTDSGQTWQRRLTPGSAWLCKISLQSAQGVGMRPQK